MPNWAWSGHSAHFPFSLPLARGPTVTSPRGRTTDWWGPRADIAGWRGVSCVPLTSRTHLSSPPPALGCQTEPARNPRGSNSLAGISGPLQSLGLYGLYGSRGPRLASTPSSSLASPCSRRNCSPMPLLAADPPWSAHAPAIRRDPMGGTVVLWDGLEGVGDDIMRSTTQNVTDSSPV
jgi:hypothetical protein